MIKAGILGASGYMGGEIIRVLLEHSEVNIEWATSRSGMPIEFHHRNLYGTGIHFIKPEEITPCDIVFIALPTGNAMALTPNFLQSGTKVIDLGADFRLKNLSDWKRIYDKEHSCEEIVKEAIYGIPELHREQIRNARVVANPGCYSSASILGLAPLIKANLIDTKKIIIDGLSGTTGAGAEPELPTHHPEIANNLIPYNVVDHRHTYEIEQELNLLTNSEVIAHFTTTYVPITRGILAISHCFPEEKVSRDQLIRLYQDFYKNEYFIKVFDLQRDPNSTWQYRPYPWVASVSGTNFCHIGLDYDERRNRIVVFSVLDSIGKGGAHVGVQNMNIMFGLDESHGLRRFGLHPY